MHPFFDVVAFPWHRKDAQEFHRQLVDGIRAFADIDFLYTKSATGLPGLPTMLTDAVWRLVLDNLTTARALRTLCDLIFKDPRWVTVRDSATAIVEAQSLTEAPILGSDAYLFLDRKRLRVHLSDLAVPESAFRVLIVRGESGSGKSWTAKLIETFAIGCGDLCAYLFDGTITTVPEVVSQLMAVLGSDEEIPQLESEDAYFRKACIRLLERASNQKRRYWIIVDDLGTDRDGGPRLDPSIKRFFDHFTLQMANPALGRWFRLVLLHYPDGTLPTKWKQGVWKEDRTSCTDVDALTIEEFLDRWGKATKKQLAEEERKRLAEGVVTKVEALLATPSTDPAKASRMQLIHDEVNVVVETLRGDGT